jgi:ADP-ribosylglycohydrolase
LYQRWYSSKPCDIGKTCAAAFCENGIVDIDTQANGALMRCAPIGAIVVPEHVAEYARNDAALSHASDVCIAANVAYCTALSYLVHTSKSDVEDAIEFAKQKCDNNDILSWINDSNPYETMKTSMNGTNLGWVRWGLSLAFYHLRMKTDFETALLSVIRAGGDTDTNACIVGGMLGALHGIDAIPQRWMTPVMHCDVRPLWLQPAHVLNLCFPNMNM